jgi:hypothetical protein
MNMSISMSKSDVLIAGFLARWAWLCDGFVRMKPQVVMIL